MHLDSMLTLELILLELLRFFSFVQLKFSLNKSTECQRKPNCRASLHKILKIWGCDSRNSVFVPCKAVTLNFMKSQPETG